MMYANVDIYKKGVHNINHYAMNYTVTYKLFC